MGRALEMLVGVGALLLVIGALLAGHRDAGERRRERDRAATAQPGAVSVADALDPGDLPLLRAFARGVRAERAGAFGVDLRVPAIRVEADFGAVSLEVLARWD